MKQQVKRLDLDENLFSVEMMGLKFKNPLGLASCSLGMRADQLINAANSGLGFVVSKSIGKLPKSGYGGRRIYNENPFLNAEGLPNPGVENFIGDIKKYKTHIKDVPLIVSVIGFQTEEYKELSTRCVDAGADAIELNLSCGHKDPRKTHYQLISQDPELVEEIVRDVTVSVNKPIIAKLSPSVTNIASIAKAAERGGAKAVSTVNTMPAMFVEVDKKGEEGIPVLSNIIGGLSGSAIHPIALRCVYEISQAVNIPVIGYGGVENHKSIVRFLYAGSSAVGGATIFYRDQPQNVVPKMLKELKGYMEEHGYTNIKKMIGLSHNYQKNMADGQIVGDPILTVKS